MARSGHKLRADPDGKGGMNTNVRDGNGSLLAEGIALQRLAIALGGMLQRPVVDESNLEGLFSFHLRWSADGANDSGPSIYSALQEQLGLKLESKKGPVNTYVVDRAERPTAN